MINNFKHFAWIFLSTIFLLISGCSSLKVINIRECRLEKNNYHVYFLPKTVIKVTVETTKRTTKKGPYSEYAEKYLGINDVPEDDNEEYFISDVNIRTFAEPDSNRIYLIRSGKKSILNNFNLRDDGLLASFNMVDSSRETGMFTNEITKNIVSREINKPAFTGMSVKKYYSNRTDTSYKVVKKDSVFVNVPVYHNKIVGKTIADKAEEMANIILNIREERISLISGDNNNFPDGTATREIIDEYNKLENEYLSLFIGKTMDVKKKYTFYFVPRNDSINKVTCLCYFSKKSGITTTNYSGSYPLMIQVIPQGITNPLTNCQKDFPGKEKDYDGIVYLVPDLALINIYNNNSLLFSEKTLISQLGTINVLPGYLFMDPNTKIRFYPSLGSLRSVEKK